MIRRGRCLIEGILVCLIISLLLLVALITIVLSRFALAILPLLRGILLREARSRSAFVAIVVRMLVCIVAPFFGQDRLRC